MMLSLLELETEVSVEAPVSLGQKLGTVTLRSGDQELAKIPLVAASAVEKLTFADLFLLVLRRAAMAKGAEGNG